MDASSVSTVKNILSFLTVFIIIVAVLVWLIYYSPLQSNECSMMTNVYGTLNGKIHSFDPTLENYQYTLKDYYIKSAYNCCSGGNYQNDYVGLCALKNLLKQIGRAHV